MPVTCTKCSEDKNLSEFSRDVKSPVGYRRYCKACASAYDRTYRTSPRGRNVRRGYKSTHVGKLHRKAERHRRRARNRAVGYLSRGVLESVILRNQVAYGRLTCVYCKDDVEDVEWHLEHLTPLSRGGTNEASNLAIACPSCNTSKGVKRYDEVPRADEEHLSLEKLTSLIEHYEERHKEWSLST